MKLPALLTALALAAGVPAAAAVSPAAASTLPTVNMEAAVKAAQIDPRRSDDTLTSGAKASVLAVERALAAGHLLDAKWVDGYFGSKTVEAYAAYQRSLGYSGLDASGLPGTTSLTSLGSGRFTVTHRIGPGARVARDGVVVDARTEAMLEAAEGWVLAPLRPLREAPHRSGRRKGGCLRHSGRCGRP